MTLLASFIGVQSVSTAPADGPSVSGGPVNGSTANCTDFVIDLALTDIDIPDPGWVWVDPTNPFRSVTGVVENSRITHTDFPAVHDSHDQNTDIVIDPEYAFLLADVNAPNPTEVDSAADLVPPTNLELEWEIGTFPSETSGGEPERTFPRWAWPSEGDRVWADGHWIFDCGHGSTVGETTHYRTEIHPARAIASMRDQIAVLPGTGETPVPVTATDLYIHGGGGFITETLYCGSNIIVSDNPDSCPTKRSPIDEDFQFDIPLPPKPFPSAVLATKVDAGPGNTIGIQPVLTPVPAGAPNALRVTVPLDGSGVSPASVYARRIKAGWIAPTTALRHLRLELNRMDLHEDHEVDPGDCECSFFWMSVDKAPNEWERLADFQVPTHDDGGPACFAHTNHMNDFDDDDGCGNGLLNFDGPVFDFFIAQGRPYTVRAGGYDQDCLDDHFGDHEFEAGTFFDCYFLSAFELNPGDNDKLMPLEEIFPAPDYGVGANDVTAFGEYELEFTVDSLALGGAIRSDVRTTQDCVPDGVSLAGQPFTCTIEVENLGPGLPRNLVVQNQLVTAIPASDVDVGPASFSLAGGFVGGPFPCGPAGLSFSCNLGTVPVGGSAVITYEVTPQAGGRIVAEATASSPTTDPNAANNAGADSAGVTVVTLDIAPPTATNELGTPGQTHEVTATVAAGAEGGVPDRPVAFEIVAGPNAGASGAGTTDALGAAAFSYVATQGLGGLGTDEIEACIVDDLGREGCVTATKEWVDTTPPVVSCPDGSNPSGVPLPGVDKSADRFFELIATDAVDPNPQLFVRDTGSGFVFGGFPSGTGIKYTRAPGSEPSQKRIGSDTDDVQWHLTGKGNPVVFGSDASQNVSDSLSCPSV